MHDPPRIGSSGQGIHRLSRRPLCFSRSWPEAGAVARVAQPAVARANKLPWPTGGVFSRKSRPVISTLPSSVSCRRRSFRSAIISNRVRWRWNASMHRRTLIEEPLEDATRYPDRAFVGAENHGELDAVALVIPGRVFGKLEKQHCLTSGGRSRMFPLCSIRADGRKMA